MKKSREINEKNMLIGKLQKLHDISIYFFNILSLLPICPLITFPYSLGESNNGLLY